MADWPLSNADAGLLAPGRQLWRLGAGLDEVEATLGDARARLDLRADPGPRLAALLGAQIDDAGRAWPGAFRFSPETGAHLRPALPEAAPWGAPSGGEAGLPQTDTVAALDPASRADLLAPTQAALFVAGAPAALYALRTALGVLEAYLPRGGGPPSGEDWVRLGVAVRSGVELPAWSAAIGAGRFGFVAPTSAGPVFVRLPLLPGTTPACDVAPVGVRSVGGAALSGGAWLAPVRAGGGLALLAREDAWSAPWSAREVLGSPDWPDASSPAGALAAPVSDGRDDVFWVGATGALAWSPGEGRAAWSAWPQGFRALPTARPWRAGDGVLWQEGVQQTPDGAGLAFRPLRWGGAEGEVRPVRNPHFSAGGWTYATSGRPARWLRPWDRPVDDEQLRTPEGAFLAPLLGFDDRAGPPFTLLAEISGEGAHAGALIRGEQPGLVRAALKQHRSLQPVQDLGAALRIGRLDDLLCVRYADRVIVAHRDEPGDYARAYSWRTTQG